MNFPISSFVAKFVGTTNILRANARNLIDPEIDIADLGKFKLYIPKKKNGCKRVRYSHEHPA